MNIKFIDFNKISPQNEYKNILFNYKYDSFKTLLDHLDNINPSNTGCFVYKFYNSFYYFFISINYTYVYLEIQNYLFDCSKKIKYKKFLEL